MSIVKKVEAKWFKVEDTNIELLIAPTDFSFYNGLSEKEIGREVFMNCLLDWKGMNNEDETPFEFNKENKEYLYSYSDMIVVSVLTESRQLREEFDALLKN